MHWFFLSSAFEYLREWSERFFDVIGLMAVSFDRLQDFIIREGKGMRVYVNILLEGVQGAIGEALLYRQDPSSNA